MSKTIKVLTTLEDLKGLTNTEIEAALATPPAIATGPIALPPYLLSTR